MIALTATLCVAIIFFGIGSWVEFLAGRATGLDGAAYKLVAGWAFASLAAVIAALTGAHLMLPALIIGILGVSGLILLRRNPWSFVHLVGAFALVSPILWIATHIQP